MDNIVVFISVFALIFIIGLYAADKLHNIYTLWKFYKDSGADFFADEVFLTNQTRITFYVILLIILIIALCIWGVWPQIEVLWLQ